MKWEPWSVWTERKGMWLPLELEECTITSNIRKTFNAGLLLVLLACLTATLEAYQRIIMGAEF